MSIAHQHSNLSASGVLLDSEDNVPEKYRLSTSFGPGLWFSIHIYAANATTPERKSAFIDFINTIAANIKCEICQQHAIQYLRTNPPIQMLNLQNPDGQDIGLFKWTWIFHNAVNRRLGKPEMSFDESYRIFAPQGSPTCLKNCGTPLRQEEYAAQTIPLVYARSPTIIPNSKIRSKHHKNRIPNNSNNQNNQNIQETELVYTSRSNAGLSFNKKFIN